MSLRRVTPTWNRQQKALAGLVIALSVGGTVLSWGVLRSKTNHPVSPQMELVPSRPFATERNRTNGPRSGRGGFSHEYCVLLSPLPIRLLPANQYDDSIYLMTALDERFLILPSAFADHPDAVRYPPEKLRLNFPRANAIRDLRSDAQVVCVSPANDYIYDGCVRIFSEWDQSDRAFTEDSLSRCPNAGTQTPPRPILWRVPKEDVSKALPTVTKPEGKAFALALLFAATMCLLQSLRWRRNPLVRALIEHNPAPSMVVSLSVGSVLAFGALCGLYGVEHEGLLLLSPLSWWLWGAALFLSIAFLPLYSRTRKHYFSCVSMLRGATQESLAAVSGRAAELLVETDVPTHRPLLATEDAVLSEVRFSIEAGTGSARIRTPEVRKLTPTRLALADASGKALLEVEGLTLLTEPRFFALDGTEADAFLQAAERVVPSGGYRIDASLHTINTHSLRVLGVFQSEEAGSEGTNYRDARGIPLLRTWTAAPLLIAPATAPSLVRTLEQSVRSIRRIEGVAYLVLVTWIVCFAILLLGSYRANRVVPATDAIAKPTESTGA